MQKNIAEIAINININKHKMQTIQILDGISSSVEPLHTLNLNIAITSFINS